MTCLCCTHLVACQLHSDWLQMTRFLVMNKAMSFDLNVTLMTLPLTPPQIWQMVNYKPYLGCPLCDVLLIAIITQLVNSVDGPHHKLTLPWFDNGNCAKSVLS